jgi:hypothetical protein
MSRNKGWEILEKGPAITILSSFSAPKARLKKPSHKRINFFISLL